MSNVIFNYHLFIERTDAWPRTLNKPSTDHLICINFAHWLDIRHTAFVNNKNNNFLFSLVDQFSFEVWRGGGVLCWPMDACLWLINVMKCTMLYVSCCYRFEHIQSSIRLLQLLFMCICFFASSIFQLEMERAHRFINGQHTNRVLHVTTKSNIICIIAGSDDLTRMTRMKIIPCRKLLQMPKTKTESKHVFRIKISEWWLFSFLFLFNFMKYCVVYA